VIVVLLGTNPYSFERLARGMDELAERHGWEVFVQLGHTSYEPTHCKWVRFVDHERLLGLMAQADVVVTQGGFGSLRDGLALGRKVVAVPRQPQLGESVDDQGDLVRALESAGRVLAVYDIRDLERAIEQAAHFAPKPSEPSRIPQIIGAYLSAGLTHGKQ
jgi:UDP-N-acetylglucosamine transferase subunit ALG13